jgi:hypothetical protein
MGFRAPAPSTEAFRLWTPGQGVRTREICLPLVSLRGGWTPNSVPDYTQYLS